MNDRICPDVSLKSIACMPRFPVRTMTGMVRSFCRTPMALLIRPILSFWQPNPYAREPNVDVRFVHRRSSEIRKVSIDLGQEEQRLS
ncbi:hypothetical protein HBI17_093900 [Parastagonospora nodorum]|nr:hypothetical protein HBH50_212050 [Parastagonospora nodorum]KAH4088782.1 hypothetical protein HBH48_118920 [Parastagonospora nodorum]KAH5541745.1 hypothetical protein HBI27_086390 [Parastagonospora nodorum]KAH5599462.1 hypothetical protein HBI45_151270 [Parastagonospora nodorum]KAH5751496.1 hypothetical protein HBI17_093900 [Parastagonospora nodorum]